MDNEIFKNLFVLEIANNHWGKLDRGLKIIRDYGQIVRYNNVKAAMKLQFRKVSDFIHKDYTGRTDNRYIDKTLKTETSDEIFAKFVTEIKNVGCIPMATPFDEASVDLCLKFEMPIIKVASSDVNDWPLIERIASTKLPTIVSTGGASEKDIDEVAVYFANRNIPLAINHCVSLYPSEDDELHLDQIDYLHARYPDNVIGLSTHEYHDWSSSMLVSYGKGARTWERHVDIDYEGVPVSKYCSLPEQCDVWFKTFHKAKEMCGGIANERRTISQKETKYLDDLVRGVYARRDIPKGLTIDSNIFDEYFYLSIPLQKGQLSCREILNGVMLTSSLKADEALSITNIDGPYAEKKELRALILQRGLEL